MTNVAIQDHRIITPIRINDVIMSFLLCLIIEGIFLVLNPGQVMHWYLLPLLICGILIGTDAIRWLRGGVDTFDPKGIIGIFGLNFFFISPLLVVYYGVNMSKGGTPPDWRPWIGVMGWFNAIGIIFYQVSHWFTIKHCSPSRKIWILKPGTSESIVWSAVFFAIISWIIMMIKMGGFAGIVEEKIYGGVGAIGGLGTFRFSAAALMPLLLIALTIRRKSNARVSVVSVCIILFVCSIIQFLTAGLLGSRRSIIYPIVWSIGIIHYFWRDIKPKILLLGMVPIILFAFVYGLYKASGQMFIDIVKGQATIKQVAEATNENISQVIVVDMSRADIQAWMIYKLKTFPEDYDLRYGKTYLLAPFTLIPRWLFPWKTPGSEKTRAGTEFMFGKGYYDPTIKRISGRVYGLAGEAVLNFGLWSIPVAFGIWGMLIGYLRRKWLSWPSGDCRLLIVPMVIILAVVTLILDSDNVWSSIISHLVIPAFVIFLISSKYQYNSEEQQEYNLGNDYEIAPEVSSRI